MNFKTTITLVVLLVIVGLIWWLVPASQQAAAPPTAAKPESAGPKAIFDPAPDAEKLTRVEIERPGVPKVAFERVLPEKTDPNTPKPPAQWRVVEPLNTLAEVSAVSTLVSTIGTVQSRAQFEPGAAGEPTVADAGLDPPAATITMTDESGKKYALDVGQKVVMSSDTYVRVAGEKTIRVANRDLLPQVKKDLSEYRSKRLMDLKPDDATKIEVQHEGTTYELARGADGEWMFDQPLRAYADKDKVRGLLTKLSGLRAEEFVDDAPTSFAKYGLEEPYLTCTVTTETKRPLPPETPATQNAESQPAAPKFETTTTMFKIALGSLADLKSEKRYLRSGNDQWVATITEANAKGLIPNLKELRDPRITRVKAADVTTLEIAGAQGTPTTLQKVNGVWQGSGDLAQLETPAVTDVLQALEDLRAIDYLDQPQDLAQYGLDHPRTVLTATAAGALAPVTLRVGSDTASGKNAYVQRGDAPTVLVVSAAQATRLAIDPLTLRAREIFSFPANQLRTIQVERGTAHYTLAHEGGPWKLTDPADASIDLNAVTVLANALSHLRGKNVVAKGDPAPFGLSTPAAATLHFEVAQPAATQPTTVPSSAPAEPPVIVPHMLRIGTTAKGSFAMKDEDPYVFELDEPVYRTLTAELLDTRLFTFKPEEVTGVKIVAPGGTLEFNKVGDQWKYAPDPYVELDQTKVQDFITELTQFRAEEYLAYRDGDLPAAGLVSTPATLTVRLAGSTEVVVNMTQERPGELPRKAALVAQRRIFRMRQADCEKLMRGLDEYVKSDKPAPPPTTPGARPLRPPVSPGARPPRPPTP